MVLTDDYRIQEQYWNKLTQFKFDLYYYGHYFEECIKILRLLRWGSAFLTALATGAWMEWHNTNWISVTCPIVILVLQVLNAAAEIFPYDVRKEELREMTNLLGPLYSKLEKEWFLIEEGELSKVEILDKINDYEKHRLEIQQHYFKNDSLPEKKKFKQIAALETDAYFKNFK